MTRRRKHQAGVGLLEILIAGMILLFVMLGMNAALISSSLISMKSKDITMATNLGQQVLETERSRCTDITYYSNLPTSSSSNLYGAVGTGDILLQRFMYTLTAAPQSLAMKVGTNPGNNVVVKLTGPPIANGITAGSRVVLYHVASGIRQTVYVLNPNDASEQFLIDDTAPQQGRQGLQNIFPAGTLVLTASKLLTVQLSYAAVNGSDVAATNRRPLITLPAYVNNPIQ